MRGRDEGAVFAYPFLWQIERDRIENPKDRTTCLTIRKLQTTREGVTLIHLWLLGISDRPRPGQIAVEVPSIERRRAGLDVDRPAFVVLSEANYDVLPLSWNYDPNSHDFGQFSAAFTAQVRTGFLRLVARKQLKKIDRMT